jgi:hypothetical protein
MSIGTAQAEAVSGGDRLLLALEALQGRLSSRVLVLASALETDSAGKLVNSPQNIARIAAVIAEAKATMIDDQFIEELAVYLEGFDEIATQVVDALAVIGPVEPSTASNLSRAYKGAIAAYLTNPETYSGTWIGVTTDIITGVVTSAPITDTLDTVAATVQAGSMTTAVESEVVSAPVTLQRSATQVAAEEAGAVFFLYQGRPIKTTRRFCAEREGRIWHIEEIKEWGRQAAAGVDLDGSGNPGWEGMVEGTNESNIMQLLGGWYGGRNSCRHILIPVPRRDVPLQDYKRMQNLGLVD